MYVEDTPEKRALRAMLGAQLSRLEAEGVSRCAIGFPERWETEYDYHHNPKTLVSQYGNKRVTIVLDGETSVAFSDNGEDYALSEDDFPLPEFRKWMDALSMLIEGL